MSSSTFLNDNYKCSSSDTESSTSDTESSTSDSYSTYISTDSSDSNLYRELKCCKKNLLFLVKWIFIFSI